MAEQSCIYLIHTLENSFSDKEKVVADFILSHSSEAVHPSIEELAARIGVSVSTLLRFVKKLGYGGYQQFRIALATETLAPESRYYEIAFSDPKDAVATAFSAARSALDMTEKLLDRRTIGEVAHIVCNVPVFYIFGIGGSGIVARDALHKLIRTGIHCLAAEDFHIQLMLASQATARDLALVISNTGANKDSLAIVEVLKKAGCRIAAITTYPRSPLARVADYLLISAAPGASIISEAFSARIAHLAIVDALYIEIMGLLKENGLDKVEKMRSAIAGRRL
ncbi:MAG TPA: MurR/RpiR family transcriptional regulator [Spirochaetaceae bacterium]|nr:MurR/RpiR family transcriptional regulator [Spirochaetaceae bacterium]